MMDAIVAVGLLLITFSMMVLITAVAGRRTGQSREKRIAAYRNTCCICEDNPKETVLQDLPLCTPCRNEYFHV